MNSTPGPSSRVKTTLVYEEDLQINIQNIDQIQRYEKIKAKNKTKQNKAKIYTLYDLSVPGIIGSLASIRKRVILSSSSWPAQSGSKLNEVASFVIHNSYRLKERKQRYNKRSKNSEVSIQQYCRG